MRLRRAASLAGGLMLAAQPALAACPSELAVYRDAADTAGIDFRPTGDSAAVTNTFKIALRDGPVLDGIVMWTENPLQSWGAVSLDCPEGDVTGEELADCTIWEGAVYAVGEDGMAGMMPRERNSAARQLILAGFAFQMQAAPALAERQPAKLPSDIFTLSGCQE